MNKKLITACFAALVLLFSSCSSGSKAASVPALIPPAEIVSDITEVKRGVVSRLKQYEGIVCPYTEPLFFKDSNSVLEKVYVTNGSEVKAGDLLAVLSTEGSDRALAELNDNIAYSERVWENKNRLAALAVEKARLELSALEASGASRLELGLKEFDIEALVYDDAHNRKLQALERERLNLLKAEIVQKAETNFLYAPFDGHILYIANTQKGEKVSDRSPFIYIADDTRLTVNYYGSEFRSVLHGSSVTALIDGTVYDLEMIEYSLEEYYAFYLEGILPPVKFKILNPDGGIGTDKHVLIRVETSRSGNALYVPLNALHMTEGGKTRFFVYVHENDTKQRRNIEVGIRNDTRAEVLEGLSEGELVYVE